VVRFLAAMRFIGANARRVFALSGGMSLVAQCLKPDFFAWHGCCYPFFVWRFRWALLCNP
jgi:hypothetical protein